MIVAIGQSDRDRRDLLEKLASIDEKPFFSQVVQSPWNDPVDVDSIHAEAKETIRDLLFYCGMPDHPRIRVLTAPAGYGKSHLLAWTRK